MVKGVSSNVGVGYTQPMQNQLPANNQQHVPQMPTKDEFVSQINKAKKKSALIGGTTVAASLLAALGGTFAKSKTWRALSVLPIALSTLTFGITTMIQSKKMGNIEKMVKNMAE